MNQFGRNGTPAEVIDQVKSWFAYNPAIEIGKLEIPVLIIQGENDLQVEVEDDQL